LAVVEATTTTSVRSKNAPRNAGKPDPASRARHKKFSNVMKGMMGGPQILDMFGSEVRGG